MDEQPTISDIALANSLEGHEGPVTTIKYSKDQRYIISASQDTTIRIWSSATCKEITKLEAHTGSVNDFAIGKDDKKLLTGGSDQSLYYWDLQKGDLIRQIRAHSEKVNSVCLSEDGSIAISGSFDSTAKIWDLRTNSLFPVQILSDSKDSITCVQAGRYEIFTTSMDGKLRNYDIRAGCLTVDQFSSPLNYFELNSLQQILLLSTMNSRIYSFSKSNGKKYQVYKGHKCAEYNIKCRFAGNEGSVISGSEEGEVFLWDLVDGFVIHRFSYGSGPILDVEVNDPFTTILVASSDSTIGIYKSLPKQTENTQQVPLI